MMFGPDIYCPWCNKICHDIDTSDIEDGWEDEVLCEHCGEQFSIVAHIQIDIETEKVIAYEPGQKVHITSGIGTGCVIAKDSASGKYLVFVDRTRERMLIEPRQLSEAPGVWSHPDQLTITFETLNDVGALCPNPA